MLAQYGSAIGGVVLLQAMLQQYFPSILRDLLESYFRKLASFFDPNVEISFPEFTGKYMKRSEAFTFIQNYLTEHVASRGKRLKADSVRDNRSLILSMDDHEQVADEYKGVKITWSSYQIVLASTTLSLYPMPQNPRYYKLTFHRRHRKLMTQSYIHHVMTEGKAIASRNRQRKLYTNDPQDSMWIPAVFKHPATFETLAMAPDKKREIMEDLTKFTERKEYYAKIGRLGSAGICCMVRLGPSTMIATMANFLNYDVYDLELTAVKDNTALRRLLMETSNKSIIVIEDIDCSLDLTGQRKEAEEDENDKDKEDDKDDNPLEKMTGKEQKSSKVTLSGLLNFIDGIWSACGGERLIVFTTNHLDKLDPALIRRGRMDKHIEMSYCCFESFKVLARNYLNIEHHPLFETIGQLFGETKMSPADVAENLMPKSDNEDVEACLRNLIQALEAAKKAETDAQSTAKRAETDAQSTAKREKREKRLKWWKETKKRWNFC
ncbi:LOW QUALITY PROTEIN: hypothetical protein BT93_I1014 [Corymbia citriodora subsp. variegata]|nr:LOW QUALITY PROTEIN: hypothetical protein BT93_I1014 [Corymbia citriodora subsp. variegata]